MEIIKRRVTAKIDGDFVVFIIGGRLNRWWKIFQHLWFVRAMPAMLAELEKKPESGFLGGQPIGLGVIVQYWRSVEQLLAYAHAKDGQHYPNWVRFNQRVGKSADLGIWHETYQVRAGQYECIYSNMQPFGLGKVAKQLEAEGDLASAAGRLGASK
jgi:hypothetical protein